MRSVLRSATFSFFTVILVLSPWLFPPSSYAEQSGAVIAPFHQEELKKLRGEHVDGESEKWKHEILFVMGVALLVLIFLTAGLGLAMVIKGKEVFVHHMLSAGATVFLAVAHAVTSIVWFSPF